MDEPDADLDVNRDPRADDPNWVLAEINVHYVHENMEIVDFSAVDWTKILSYDEVTARRAALEQQREAETTKLAEMLSSHHCWGNDTPGLFSPANCCNRAYYPTGYDNCWNGEDITFQNCCPNADEPDDATILAYAGGEPYNLQTRHAVLKHDIYRAHWDASCSLKHGHTKSGIDWGLELDYWQTQLCWSEDLQNSDAFFRPKLLSAEMENQILATHGETIRHNPDRIINILDIGSGPISTIGMRTSWGANVSLTMVDPLACQYEMMLWDYLAEGFLDKFPETDREDFLFSLRNSIRLPGSGETVVETLQDAGINFQDFSYVHSSNSLDHTQDPILAMRAISRVIPTGQSANLTMHRNVAKRHAGRGLHQWNFDIEGDQLIIRTHQRGVPFDRLPITNVNRELAYDADLITREGEVADPITRTIDEYIYVEMTRRNLTETGCNQFCSN